MNLTSKSRYALKILMDLAAHRGVDHVDRSEIALRQGIPTNYLDQIMIRLRRSSLVESVRGRGGGYRLGRPVEAITVWDIFCAVEDSLYPVKCADDLDSCDFSTSCASTAAWKLIFHRLKSSLTDLTLDQIVGTMPEELGVVPVTSPQECRPGRGLLFPETRGEKKQKNEPLLNRAEGGREGGYG